MTTNGTEVTIFKSVSGLYSHCSRDEFYRSHTYILFSLKCGESVSNYTSEITACAEGEDGVKYLKEMEEISKKIQHPVKLVPTALIDGKVPMRRYSSG